MQNNLMMEINPHKCENDSITIEIKDADDDVDDINHYHSQNSNLLNLIYDETNKIYAHGLERILNNSSGLFLKRMWIFVYLISTLMCALSVSTSIHNYLQWRVNTKIEVKYERQLAFPTISFCNQNPFITKSGNAYIQEYYLKKYKINITSYTDLFTYKRNFSDFDQEILFYQTFDPKFNLTRKKSFGLPLFKMLYYPLFNKIVPTRKDLSWFYHLDYGNCFKFNSDRDSEGKLRPILMVDREEENVGFSAEIFIGKIDSNNDVLYKTEFRGLNVVIDESSRFPIKKSGINLKVQFKFIILLYNYSRLMCLVYIIIEWLIIE